MKVELTDTQVRMLLDTLKETAHKESKDKEAYRELKETLKRHRNPIVDNRIVNDISFATRFRSFLNGVTVNDLMSEEELEYLKMVADDLLEWQKKTVTDPNEIQYFKNNGIKLGKQ